MEDAKAGTVVWMDLTVPDAARIRDFYAAVVGWKPDPIDMGGYADFTMRSAGGRDPVAGVCHARGVNAKLPPHWIVYVAVPGLDAALTRVRELGGEVVDGPRGMGEKRFALIQDPAGAYLGLIGP